MNKVSAYQPMPNSILLHVQTVYLVHECSCSRSGLLTTVVGLNSGSRGRVPIDNGDDLELGEGIRKSAALLMHTCYLNSSRDFDAPHRGSTNRLSLALPCALESEQGAREPADKHATPTISKLQIRCTRHKDVIEY